MGASDVCPEICKCLQQYVTVKAVVLEIVKSVGNLSANNPNNQTKLGLSGACELICEILQNMLISPDKSEKEKEREMKRLLSQIRNDKALKVTFSSASSASSSDQSERSKEDLLDVENGDLAKWCFWAVGNLMQIGKMISVIYRPYSSFFLVFTR